LQKLINSPTRDGCTFLPIQLNNNPLWIPCISKHKHSQLYFKWRKIKLVKNTKRYFSQFFFKYGNNTLTTLKEQASSKFVRHYFTKGLYIKAYKHFLLAVQQIYKLVIYNQTSKIQSKFGGYSPVLNYLMCTTFMFNTTSLLVWAAKSLSQVFIFKCFYANKFYKRKYKKKFNLKIVYLNKQYRLSNSLRRLSFFIETRKYSNLNARIFFALGDILFSYKKGELYKKKLYIYKKAFTLFKKNK
jgi:hypothetical protein